MCGKGIVKDNAQVYSESAAKASDLFIKDGFTIMENFLAK
jgi:hypothetical protein